MYKFFCFLLLALTYITCNKAFDVVCPAQDENQGLVIQSFFDTEVSCFDESFMLNDLSEGLVIHTVDTYRSTIALVDLTGNACVLPDIDFTQFTLLGLKTQGTGCTRTYRRSVEAKGNGFEYEVTVRECGNCEPLEIRTHWVTIPKISEDATVTFKIRTQKYNE